MSGPIDPGDARWWSAQIAIALARSPGGNTFTRIDSVDGMMNAAPTPISGAAADDLPDRRSPATRRRLARKKVASPNCSAPLRPKRSPSAPVVNSSPANTSEYDGDHPLQLRLGRAEVARQRRAARR